MAAQNFKLFLGCLGNGVTVCNSAVMEDGDFKMVARAGSISSSGCRSPSYSRSSARQRKKGREPNGPRYPRL